MDNPKVGDIVLYNGYRAEVIGLGSIATARGLATTYNIKLPGGSSVNVLREEFTFPVQ
jgi:hypothetical protein